MTNEASTCVVSICSRPRQGRLKYCEAHIQRLKRTGSLMEDMPIQIRNRALKSYPKGQKCAVPGCGRPVSQHGWCAAHARRLARNPNANMTRLIDVKHTVN